MKLGQKDAYELRQSMVHHALQVLHQTYDNLHGHDSIHLMSTRCVYDKDSLHKFKQQLQVGYGLTLANREQSFWIFCDVVLDAVGRKVKKLKAKSPVQIVIFSSNDIHHLRK